MKIFSGRYNVHMMTGTAIHPSELLPRLLDGLCRRWSALRPTALLDTRWTMALLCLLLLGTPQQAMAGEGPQVVDLPTVRKQLRSQILEGRAQPALQRILALRKEHADDAGLALLEGEAYYATERFELAVDAFRNGLVAPCSNWGVIVKRWSSSSRCSSGRKPPIAHVATSERVSPGKVSATSSKRWVSISRH